MVTVMFRDMKTDTPSAAEVAALAPRQYKSLETRLRNAAKRQKLVLVKSKRRDPNAFDYGHYWLVDINGNTVVGDDETTGLDGIAAYLYRNS